MGDINKTVVVVALGFLCFVGVVITQISGDLVDSNYEDCLESSEVTLYSCINKKTRHENDYGADTPYSDDLLKTITIHNMECVKEDRLQKENCKSLIVAE